MDTLESRAPIFNGRRPRILIFSLAYYPHVGGAEIALKELTDRMGDFEFHMVTLRFGSEAREEQAGNVRIHRVGHGSSLVEKFLFMGRAASCARRLHREKPFDAFWAMMSYMVVPIVRLRARGIYVPYLVTLQEGDTFDHSYNRLRVLLLRRPMFRGIRNATAVQVISHYLRGWAERIGYAGHVQVIPNGANTCLLEGARIAHDGTILITTSRLVRKNAVDTIIKALPLLPENISFSILGSGPEEENLKALARELGVLERVRFEKFVDHQDLPRHLHAADIFVRPSRSEGMGNSFIEAMAAGLPVIGTQEGGIADFLFDAKRNPDKEPTGWAVDVDAPEQIAEKVEEILKDERARARTVENAKKLVREHYDWDTIAVRMQSLLHDVCRAK